MSEEIGKLTSWSWEAIAALCCFAGGMATGTLGSVLTALSWIVGGEVHPWVHVAGTILLLLTIPLLIFSGYCMDWIEQKPKARSDNRAKSRDEMRPH